MTPSPQPGARWQRCDLHVHTPFDSDRTFGENVKHAIEAFANERTEKLAEIAQRFVEACRSGAEGEGIDLVALTDHNSIEGYRRLKPLFESIAQQAEDEGTQMPVVLPGVEFSVGGERPLHFLTIFASDTPAEEIEGAIRHVFAENEPFDPDTGTPRATGNSVDQFLKKLYEYCRPSSGDRKLSFVLLPAHADSSRGVEEETAGDELTVATTLWDEMRGHLREWVVSRRDWNGFQTARSYADLPQAFRELLARWHIARRGLVWDELDETDRRRVRDAEHWPLVECSDPHRYEDIGSRYTWLKMETLDVEGIRLALLDPESRLRRMADGQPGQAYPQLQRIAIHGTDFFEDLELSFSPCLNTLIGGRGSGKSTVLECARFALDRDRDEDFDSDEAQIRKTVADLLTEKPERDFGETPGMLLPGHRVDLDLKVSDHVYHVTRSGDEIEVRRDDDEEATGLDVRALVLPRILSQRQIASIAKDPDAQRRELDALADPDGQRDFAERRRELLEEVEGMQVRRRRLVERQETLPARETELRKVIDKIEFLEQGGNEEILARFRSFQAEDRWLSQSLDLLNETATDLDERARELQSRGAPPDGASATWTASVSERVEAALNEASGTLRDRAQGLRHLVEEIAGERASEWQPAFDEAKTAYDELRVQMEDRGVEFGQHEPLLQQRAELEAELTELRALAAELTEVEDAISEQRVALLDLHDTRLTARRQLATGLEAQDTDVRIEVVAFGDDGDFRSNRETWFGGAGLQERDWDVLADYVFAEDGATPDRLRSLVRALRADVTATRATGHALAPTDSETAALVDGEDAALTRNFYNALQHDERIRLDELERYLPEDRVEARVRGADGAFKPIEQGSIGQRSTAILALLLSAGDQPLIIDQPEDDLDNQYVYDVVVDILRKRKFSRQIVIATHNANIPVNGDAELIVALGVEERLGTVLTSGSIDRRDVKQAVATIMEGSSEAFRLRRERYGY